jgi:hypothetical protein
MLPELNDYDWGEVFGEGGGGNCTTIRPNRPPHDRTTSLATFSREDVALISGLSEGERDGRDWIIYGQLKDDRWFVARAGCDYTGWDCQAWNSGSVAASEHDIIWFGLDPDERERFGLLRERPYVPLFADAKRKINIE